MVDFIEIAFSAIYLPIIFIIATFLLYKSKKLNFHNLYFMSFFFFLTGLDFIFEILAFNIFAHIFFAIFTNSPLILLIFFIKYTFYRQKESAYEKILVAFIILKILDLVLRIPNQFTVPQDVEISISQIPLYYTFEIIVIINNFLVQGWFFYVTYTTYISLKNVDIAPWIKKRYLWISSAILCSAISTFLSIFIPPTGGWYQGSPIALMIAIFKIPFVMIFYFGSLIGWIMPKKLKQYYNRNYQPVEELDLSEEELMNFISNQLSNK